MARCRRRPAGGQGPLLHRGRPEPGGLADPRGLPAALHRHGGRAPRGGGAPLLGKTNQDEFAMGSSNENSATARCSTPGTARACPAGRRAAAPAAVAAGLAPWAIGTDTGGSIRQPAALCGIVGLKPTYGAVSRYGMIAFASSLDQAGAADPRRHRRGAAVRAHGRARPVRRDLARVPRARRAAGRERPQGASASASPRSSPARGSSPACGMPSRRR